MCRNSTEVIGNRYGSIKNKAKRYVSRAMREDEKGLTGLKNCQNGLFRIIKGLRIDSKEVDGGRCIRGS